MAHGTQLFPRRRTKTVDTVRHANLVTEKTCMYTHGPISEAFGQNVASIS